MPQLLFQFQRNGDVKSSPVIETLMHILSQRKITYDDIQKQGDALSVNFSSPEEAKNAFKGLDGMEFMGSYLTIKPTRKDSGEQQYHKRNYNRHNRNNRDDYSRDQDGYPEQREQRSNYRYNYKNPHQRQEVEQYPCRILIPSNMVKVILGKAGATITDIQTKTNTKIDIHRDKGPIRGRPTEDTLATIKGDPESFSEAIKEILTVMNTEYEKLDAKDRKPLQLKLLAHDLLCGRIIGKGGNNLKQTRQESGVAKLIISNSIYEEGSHFIPSSLICTGERVITIEGSVQGICTAEEIISKRLREYMQKDTKNSGSFDHMIPPMGAQSGGYYGPGILGDTNYPPHMMYQRSLYSYGGSGGYGNQMHGFHGGYPGYNMNNYPGILGHGYSPFGRNIAPQPQYNHYDESETTCVIIPTKEVGAIIGRNGGYISRVKQYSNAQVRVIKGEEGGDSRVEIIGPPDSQWKASLCVFSKIKETMKVQYSEAQLKTEYMVPGFCVGRIIGKKGQVVQDIQDKAQADIEVPKDKQGGDDVPVFITGTFNGTQIALNRIRDIVHRAHQKTLTPNT